MNRKRYPKGNYQKAILEAYTNGVLVAKPGTATVIDVYHDDWCPFLQGGVCDCNPDIIQRPGEGSVYKGASNILSPEKERAT